MSMQNQDGGFAAFDKDNVGNFILAYFAGDFAGDFADSVDLFDESSADVTGHVLEAFGRSGMSRTNSAVVQRAITYLRGAQRSDGSFEGRWGVNTLYGTGAAVVGLARAGLPTEDGMIVKALDYFASKQNSDGGFGESSQSYVGPGARPQRREHADADRLGDPRARGRPRTLRGASRPRSRLPPRSIRKGRPLDRPVGGGDRPSRHRSNAVSGIRLGVPAFGPRPVPGPRS